MTTQDDPGTNPRLTGVMPNYTASDLERTIGFWRDGLGFEVTERWEEEGQLRGVMLRSGEVVIGLSQDDFAQGRDRAKGVGHRIFIQVAGSVDVLAERLRRHGGRIVSGPEDSDWGRNFSAEDPDGYRVTFAQT